MGEAKRKQKVGATGDFPRGKLNENDEGGLAVGIADQDGTVIINFGKPIAWLGLSAQEACDFAGLIVRHAKKVAKDRGVVITVNL